MSSTEIEQVIAQNNCVGCGACAFAAPENYAMSINHAGHYTARITDPDAAPDLSAICPMSGAGRDETQIAATLYPDLEADTRIGRYKSTLAGHVVAGDFRAGGSSGGLISWLAVELLKRGKIDAVLHVRATDTGDPADPLFNFAVSETEAEITSGSKSRYYPITMAEVLPQITASDKRFLVIGLPCFIKSIRLMQEAGTISAEQVPYTIGLVCGHLKSRHYASYLAWQRGVPPGQIQSFDFRHKIEGRKASRYGFALRSTTDPEAAPLITPMTEVQGRDWGEGQFKNPACEFCDDVLAECADIAVGDAWLPGYLDDYLGANVVVTRNAEIDAIVAEARAAGDLEMDDIPVGKVAQSQSSGIRHRREGLAHRLARRQARGIWVPRKRVEPKIVKNQLRRWVYDLRQRIAERSAPVFADVVARGGTLRDYERRMAPTFRTYRALSDGATNFKKLIRRLRK